MTLFVGDIVLIKSTNEVDGIPNLGGAKNGSEEEVPEKVLHTVFDKTTDEQGELGTTKFRCFYVKNKSLTDYFKNPIAFIVMDTESPSDKVSVGWGSSKIGDGLTGDFVEQEIDDEHTYPENVTFFDANSRSGGALLNADIPPGTTKALWFRCITVNDAAPQSYNKWAVRFVADNLYVDIPAPTGNTIPGKIEFPIFGEMDVNGFLNDIFKRIFQRNPDLAITIGNNIFTNNSTTDTQSVGTWINMWGGWIGRLLMGFGIDDILTSGFINKYINAISPHKFQNNINSSKLYTSKDYGNIHFLMMDTSGSTSYLAGSPQHQFIEADLKTAYSNQQIDWIFVGTNKPFYSSQTTSATRYTYEDLRSIYHEMFTRYGVHLVFQGTFLNYQRSKVLSYNNPSGTDSSIPISFEYDGPDNYTFDGKSFPDGQIYINVGTGGRGHDVVSSNASYTQFVNYTNFGYFYVLVDNTKINRTVDCRFYSTDEKQLDRFTITRIS